MVYQIPVVRVHDGDISISGLDFQNRLQQYVETLDRVVERMRFATSLPSLSEFCLELPRATENCDLLGQIKFCQTEFSLTKAYRDYPFLHQYLQLLGETGKKLYQIAHSGHSALWQKTRHGLEPYLSRVSEFYQASVKQFNTFHTAYCFLSLAETAQVEVSRSLQQLTLSNDKRLPLYYQMRFLNSLEKCLHQLSAQSSVLEHPNLLSSYKEMTAAVSRAKEALQNVQTKELSKANLKFLLNSFENLVQTAAQSLKTIANYLENESIKEFAKQENIPFRIKKETDELTCREFWRKLNLCFERCGVDLLERLNSFGNIKSLQLVVGSSILEYNATDKVLWLGVLGSKELLTSDVFRKANSAQVIDQFLDALVLSIDKTVTGYNGSVSLIVNETPVYCNRQGQVTLDRIGLSGAPTHSLERSLESSRPRSQLPLVSQITRLFQGARSEPSAPRLPLYEFSREFLKLAPRREKEDWVSPSYTDLYLFWVACQHLGLRSFEAIAQSHLKTLETEMRSQMKEGTTVQSIPEYVSPNVKVSAVQADMMSATVRTYLNEVAKYVPIKEHIEDLMTRSVMTRLIPLPEKQMTASVGCRQNKQTELTSSYSL